MKIIGHTERLVIRQLAFDDAAFIVRLLNEESFIRYIADKQVRTLSDAKNYLGEGPLLSYQTYGFGLNLVSLKESGTPIGICGLLKRASLNFPDLGYALLDEFCGKGYAREAANFVLKEEMATHDLSTVLAVTFPDNLGSNSLLKKAGFTLKGHVELYDLQNNLYEYHDKS